MITPLHLACEYEAKDIVELLIKSKADVEATDINGNTPLHYAAIHDNKEIFELMLKSLGGDKR